jgi:hypothetical protein
MGQRDTVWAGEPTHEERGFSKYGYAPLRPSSCLLSSPSTSNGGAGGGECPLEEHEAYVCWIGEVTGEEKI